MQLQPIPLESGIHPNRGYFDKKVFEFYSIAPPSLIPSNLKRADSSYTDHYLWANCIRTLIQKRLVIPFPRNPKVTSLPQGTKESFYTLFKASLKVKSNKVFTCLSSLSALYRFEPLSCLWPYAWKKPSLAVNRVNPSRQVPNKMANCLFSKPVFCASFAEKELEETTTRKYLNCAFYA